MTNDTLKQLLLSFLNATLMLAIILVSVGLMLVSKVESFTADVISDVNFGLLREVDKDVLRVADAISSTERDLRDIATLLDQLVTHPQITLDRESLHELQSVRAQLVSLHHAVSRLTASHEGLSNVAVRTIATAIADTYLNIRGCKAAMATHLVSRGAPIK